MNTETNTAAADGSGWTAFIDMGGYASYVWTSYGLVFLVLAGLLWYAVHGLRRDQATLNLLLASQEGSRKRGPRTGQTTAESQPSPSHQDADHEAQA